MRVEEDFRKSVGVVGGILAALTDEERAEWQKLVDSGMSAYDASQVMVEKIHQDVLEATGQ